MDLRDEHDKRKIEEYKKNPFSNLSDSINRSTMGDIGQLTKGGCLARIITTVIIIGSLLMISRFL